MITQQVFVDVLLKQYVGVVVVGVQENKVAIETLGVEMRRHMFVNKQRVVVVFDVLLQC